MGWRNMNVVSFFLLGILLAFPFVVSAKEPAWRTMNSEQGTTVPSYKGENNPFPTKRAPMQKKKKTARPVQPKKTEVSVNLGALRVAGILAELRSLFSSGNFGQPDTSAIYIQGRLLGKNGGAILVRDRWRKVGDKIAVSVKSVQQVQKLLTALDRLDPILSEEMRGELDKRLSESSLNSLSISSLSGEDVKLKDGNGRVYSIPFVRKEL